MNPEDIHQYLTETEIAELDMIAIANILLDRTSDLSHRANDELLTPISDWSDDPDFMKKYEKILEDQVDWAKLKRRQREWSRQEKMLAAERLRLYWAEIKRKKNLRSELASTLSESPLADMQDEYLAAEISMESLHCLVKPFSPAQQAKTETELEFSRASATPHNGTLILPWRLILTHDIRGPTDFDTLPQYLPNSRLDTVAKFATLLQLDQEDSITIIQAEPFGQIVLHPTQDEVPKGSVIITDREGTEYTLDWSDLSDHQRNKVIVDRLSNKILCRCAT